MRFLIPLLTLLAGLAAASSGADIQRDTPGAPCKAPRQTISSSAECQAAAVALGMKWDQRGGPVHAGYGCFFNDNHQSIGFNSDVNKEWSGWAAMLAVCLPAPPQPVQATAPAQSAPVSEDTSGGNTGVAPSYTYRKDANTVCGHCNIVDPTFGPGGEKWQSAARDDVTPCMATCDAHEDCLGFNYSESHGKCWFRNNQMDCHVGADADRDCYTKQKTSWEPSTLITKNEDVKIQTDIKGYPCVAPNFQITSEHDCRAAFELIRQRSPYAGHDGALTWVDADNAQHPGGGCYFNQKVDSVGFNSNLDKTWSGWGAVMAVCTPDASPVDPVYLDTSGPWFVRDLVADEGEGLAGVGAADGKTLAECKDWCNKTARCKSFAYHPSGGCWLKAKCVSEDEPARGTADRDAAWKSFYKQCDAPVDGCTSDGTRYSPWGDVPTLQWQSGPAYVNSPENCQQACQSAEDCKHWSYIPFSKKPSWHVRNGECHMSTGGIKVDARGTKAAEEKYFTLDTSGAVSGHQFCPAVDGVCQTTNKGRCGPLFGHCSCSDSNKPYCNENNGWCGNSEAHKTMQLSDHYDWTGDRQTCHLWIEFDNPSTSGGTAITNDAHMFEYILTGVSASSNQLGELVRGDFTGADYPVVITEVPDLGGIANRAHYLKIRRLKGNSLDARFTAKVRCGILDPIQLRNSPTDPSGLAKFVRRDAWFHNPNHAVGIELDNAWGGCPTCRQGINSEMYLQLVRPNGDWCRAHNDKRLNISNSAASTNVSEMSFYVTCFRPDVGNRDDYRVPATAVSEVRFVDRNNNWAPVGAGESDYSMFSKVKVWKPNFATTNVSPTWVKANDDNVAWKSQPWRESDQPPYYAAYQEATVLGVGLTLDSLPVEFCWKTGNNDKTPGCKGDDWTRHEAMCYKDCRDGYTGPVAGVCWDKCRDGYADHGATCFKAIHTFYFKHSYRTEEATLLGDRAGCDENYYKSGARCYKDCGKINGGMVNCGIGACSYSSEACAGEIADMSLQTIQAIFEFGTFISGYGGAFKVTKLAQLGQQSFAKASTYYIEQAQNTLATLRKTFESDKWTQTLRANLLRNIRAEFVKHGKQEYIDILDEDTERGWAHVVDQVISIMKRQIKTRQSTNAFKLGEATAIGPVMDNCIRAGQTGKTNDNIACAHAAMDFLNWFDWTGITTLAMAYLKPVC